MIELTLSIPSELHERLVEQAELWAVSIEQAITFILAGRLQRFSAHNQSQLRVLPAPIKPELSEAEKALLASTREMSSGECPECNGLVKVKDRVAGICPHCLAPLKAS